MKTNKTIAFPFYSGNIKLTKVIGHITLEQFIESHRKPKPRTEKIMQEIMIASQERDMIKKRELKHKLFSFTPSVFIQLGINRKYDNVESWTGLMQLDFDGIETVDKAHDLKYYLFTTYPNIVCCYISPSGRGVKALMSIKTPNNKEHFKAIHKAVEKEFEQLGYFDVATKNGLLPLFLSVDYNILYRDISECIEWDYEDWTKPNTTNLKSTPNLKVFVPTEKYSNQEQFNLDKTTRIFSNKITNIVDSGHPQLRRSCLVLGSRSAAGYIGISDAIALATSCIESNSYFSKGIDGYISTAIWAINEGYKAPMYYDN